MKIKVKILTGFLLIIVMLALAGAMSIYEFSRIGKSVNQLIEENYKTIEASKSMIRALEREDSGVLLLLSGKWEKGHSILNSADSLFNAALNVAKNNITEKDEDKYIIHIEESYSKFKSTWIGSNLGLKKKNNIDWYLTEVHENFLKAMIDVEALMDLNQQSLYEEATSIKNQSVRAIMPGIVAIASALVFLLIFNFFIRIILVRPIQKLISSVSSFHAHSTNFSADISNNDELKVLEIEILKLTQRLKK